MIRFASILLTFYACIAYASRDRRGISVFYLSYVSIFFSVCSSWVAKHLSVSARIQSNLDLRNNINLPYIVNKPIEDQRFYFDRIFISNTYVILKFWKKWNTLNPDLPVLAESRADMSWAAYFMQYSVQVSPVGRLRQFLGRQARARAEGQQPTLAPSVRGCVRRVIFKTKMTGCR